MTRPLSTLTHNLALTIDGCLVALAVAAVICMMVMM